jgi:uncharacterized protein (TIGR02452 family)
MLTTHDQTERIKAILAQGAYDHGTGRVILGDAVEQARQKTVVIPPGAWDDLRQQAMLRCRHAPAPVVVAAETTLTALWSLHQQGLQGLGILNFASAVCPGGGWDRGSEAQEESLIRASGLLPCLQAVPEFYLANRRHGHPFATDHAIWTAENPFFIDGIGTLRERPLAGVITMPAPNVAGLIRLSPQECLELPKIWERRIEAVLLLAVARRVEHLILGAWGCGAFGNDPAQVAESFRKVLFDGTPWLTGLSSVTFAIHDTSRSQRCLHEFRGRLTTQGV